MYFLHADFSVSEPDEAIMEEQEAIAMQQRLAEQLTEEDFGMEMFTVRVLCHNIM